MVMGTREPVQIAAWMGCFTCRQLAAVWLCSDGTYALLCDACGYGCILEGPTIQYGFSPLDATVVEFHQRREAI